MKYRIPKGTKCLVAPDDDLTPYRKRTATKDYVGELRWELDTGWIVVAVAEIDSVVQVRIEQVEEIK